MAPPPSRPRRCAPGLGNSFRLGKQFAGLDHAGLTVKLKLVDVDFKPSETVRVMVIVDVVAKPATGVMEIVRAAPEPLITRLVFNTTV